MATVKLAAALPLELALHTLIVLAHPPILLSAVAIAVSSTTLAVWIVEPAVMRALGSWLHAPATAATTADHRAPGADDGTTLTLPGPGGQAVVLDQPGDPFAPAETARAHRLAELARTATARIRRAASPSNAPRPHRGRRP